MWAELHELGAAICSFLHWSNLLFPFGHPEFQQLEAGLQTKRRENWLYGYHITEVCYLKTEEIPALLCLSPHRCHIIRAPSLWFLGIPGEWNTFLGGWNSLTMFAFKCYLCQSESLKRWPIPFLFYVVFNICLHYSFNMCRYSEYTWQFLWTDSEYRNFG